jgi:hypothetical protein
MGGASLGSVGGMFGSTMGSSANAPAGTTPGMLNAATNKYEAFNPATQAGSWTPSTGPNMENLSTAGLDDATGLPTYITNFLSTGGGAGTLTAPVATAGGAAVTSNALKAAPGGKALPKEHVDPAKLVTKPSVAVKTPAATPAASTIHQVAGSGNSGQQPLYVNDQWNFQTGTSQPMATPALGGPSANQGGQAPIYSDGKGNFFFDAAGTKPVTGPAAQQFKFQYGMG